MHCLRTSPANLKDYFRKVVRKKVNKDRSITLNDRLYEGPVALIGKRVELLYHESEPDKVEVKYQNKSFGIALPVNLTVNYRVKRDKNNNPYTLTTIHTVIGAESYGLLNGGIKMNDNYRTFFALNKEPFGTDIRVTEILKTPELMDIKNRFDYVTRLGAIGIVTGEVGSGKSTALRYALEKLHPSEYRTLYITASSGSIMEFYRQFVYALDIHLSSNSKVIMVRMIKKEITDLICYQKNENRPDRR